MENGELKEIYDEICAIDNNGPEFLYERKYELALNVDGVFWSKGKLPIKTEDRVNGLVYELGMCSIEYCIYLICLWIDINKYSKSKRKLYSKLRFRLDRYAERVNNVVEEINWKSALVYCLGIISIRIESDSNWDINKARRKKTAYCFEFMYKTGRALLEYNNIRDIFALKVIVRKSFNYKCLECSPYKEYKADLIDYYRLAISSMDPYIKYISLYHIIEYFYDEVFKERIVEDLKNKITHPDFSYKDGEKLYEIVKFVRNRIKMNDELGSGNELESLKYVLKKYVNILELKTKLSEIDKEMPAYYQTVKISFCKAPTIQWNDSDGVYKNISKRIYCVRNALVHSKSGKNEERYKPYKDENELFKEIPLIKLIAEFIIISSGETV